MSKEKRLETLKAKYGPDFFRNIGLKGAQATKDAAKARPEEFKERGARGGNVTLRRHGTSHFSKAVKTRYAKKKEQPE